MGSPADYHPGRFTAPAASATGQPPRPLGWSGRDVEARIAAAHAKIKDYDKAKIDADPDADITVPMGDNSLTLKRCHYMQNFVLPNVYFHVTAAYLNLRNCNVPIGKGDYMGR